MDKNQLITIVITAAVTVIAKEIFTWLISVVKSMSAFITIRQKLSAIFSKKNLRVMWDIWSIAFYLAFLIWFAQVPGSPSRLEFLLVIGIVIGLAISVISLLWGFATRKIEKQSTAQK